MTVAMDCRSSAFQRLDQMVKKFDGWSCQMHRIACLAHRTPMPVTQAWQLPFQISLLVWSGAPVLCSGQPVWWHQPKKLNCSSLCLKRRTPSLVRQMVHQTVGPMNTSHTCASCFLRSSLSRLECQSYAPPHWSGATETTTPKAQSHDLSSIANSQLFSQTCLDPT
jgi:hypothetical protein